MLASPDTLTIKLAGTSEAPNASGVVKYSGRTGTVVCSANLPPLPAEKVYELWRIPVNGAPISAGVFEMGDEGHGRMVTAVVPANTEVKAFAVTIESAGGVAQPTGPRVCWERVEAPHADYIGIGSLAWRETYQQGRLPT